MNYLVISCIIFALGCGFSFFIRRKDTTLIAMLFMYLEVQARKARDMWKYKRDNKTDSEN
jgi:hypothetical protein